MLKSNSSTIELQNTKAFLNSLGPRILVIGAPAAGKSTIAKKLSRFLGIPVHHLDDLAWLPGWRRRPHKEFIDLQRNIVAGECWIMEGWHASTLDVRLKSATDVVVLHIPVSTCLWRFYSRAWQRWALGDATTLPAPLQTNHRRLQPIIPDLRMIPCIITSRRRLRATREMMARNHNEVGVFELSFQSAVKLSRYEMFS